MSVVGVKGRVGRRITVMYRSGGLSMERWSRLSLIAREQTIRRCSAERVEGNLSIMPSLLGSLRNSCIVV